MFSKLLYTLSIIFLASMCVLSNQTNKEGYLLHPMTVKLEKEFCEKDKNGNIVNCVQYPNYHAFKNTKFSSLGLDAAVQHNRKNRNNSMLDVGLVTHKKVTDSDMHLSNMNTSQNCEKSGQCTTSSCNISLENFSDSKDNNVPNVKISNAVNHPPEEVKDQLNAMYDDATKREIIVRDRLIYANGKTRGMSDGDPIRGDLAIVYDSPGMYRPHQATNPSKQLRQGAINILTDNESNMKLNKLIHESSGGTITTIGGVDISQEESINKNLSLRSLDVSNY